MFEFKNPKNNNCFECVNFCNNENLLFVTNRTKQKEYHDSENQFVKSDLQKEINNQFYDLQKKCNLFDLDISLQFVERDFTKVFYFCLFYDAKETHFHDDTDKCTKQIDLIENFVSNFYKSIINIYFPYYREKIKDNFKQHLDETESGFNVIQIIGGDNFSGFLITETDE